MGNSGWTADPNTIVIPANAGDAPRIVITSAPPESVGYPLAAAILFYWNATDYFYIGMADFGDDPGVFVRGFSSVTTGTSDHYEQMSYSNAVDSLNSQRYIEDFGTGNNYFEFINDGEIQELADASFTRYAPDGNYRINSSVPASAAQEPGMTIAANASSGVLATFTTTETAVQVMTQDADLPDGFFTTSRYLLIFNGRVRSTIAGDRVRLQIRQDNAAGAVLANVGDIICDVAGIGVPVTGVALYTGRNLGGETVVLTGQRIAGTGTCSFDRVACTAQDLGSSAQL